MKACLGLLLFFSALPVTAAEPAIEFTGILAVSDSMRFALRNSQTGVSTWLKIGDGFSGYTLTAFERADETVVLTKDSVATRIKLSSAKAESGATRDAPPEILRAVRNNLRQLAVAADQHYLENGKTSATLDDLVGPDRHVKQLIPVDGESYATIEFKEGNEIFTVRTASGYVVTLDLRPVEHIIKAGDTLTQIARQNNTSPARLLELNPDLEAAKLRIGHKLRLR